ncbi:hypothetical protein ABZW18_18890 [Streptomyces sp. NPDC004647]|uniref:hypothetical protein n=1 Tax=Streptomyces sp. NPDC004647 TaxID=3154671 RepID=UPI0033A4CF37
MAELPTLAVHRPALTGLSHVLDERNSADERSSAAADGQPAPPDTFLSPPDAWAQLDLLNSFGRPETYTVVKASPSTRAAAVIEHVPPVLIFVPLGITWFGLSNATDAYQELRSTDAGRRLAEGRTFLELWQEGFGGRLDGGFAFGSMIWWTIGTLAVLAVVILGSGILRRIGEQRDDRTLREAADRLGPLLTEAQLRLNALRWESPDRFTGELGRAAGSLQDLLKAGHRSQAETGRLLTEASGLLRSVQEVARRLGTAPPQLDRAADGIRQAADGMRAAQQDSAAATRSLTQSLGEDLERTRAGLASAAEDSARTVREAADLAARSVGTLGEQSAQTVSALSAAATQRMDEVGVSVERLVTQAGEQVDAALAGLREDVRGSVEALKEAGDSLGSAGGELGGWVRRTLEEGAGEIARTYRLAIAAAAVELARSLEETGKEQGARIQAMSTVVDRYDEVLRGAVSRQDTALATFERTLTGLTAAVNSLCETVALLDATAARFGPGTRSAKSDPAPAGQLLDEASDGTVRPVVEPSRPQSSQDAPTPHGERSAAGHPAAREDRQVRPGPEYEAHRDTPQHGDGPGPDAPAQDAGPAPQAAPHRRPQEPATGPAHPAAPS